MGVGGIIFNTLNSNPSCDPHGSRLTKNKAEYWSQSPENSNHMLEPAPLVLPGMLEYISLLSRNPNSSVVTRESDFFDEVLNG
jgi:hypothetical protein